MSAKYPFLRFNDQWDQIAYLDILHLILKSNNQATYYQF